MTPPEKFIRALAETSAATERAPDWPAIKKTWLDAVDALLARIETFIEPAANKVRVHRDTIHRVEEGIGPYDVATLVIEAGPTRIVVEPIARLAIGSEGRVDIRAGGRRVMLVHIDGTWYRAGRDMRGVTTSELTDELLDEILADLVR